MSITMFSVGKTSFEMYFQTITNESGVRSVCYDASIQPYPLVLVLWLYTYTVNLHYNTIVTHLERPENKKCPNFCKTAATQCPKKRCTKGSVHEKKNTAKKRTQRWIKKPPLHDCDPWNAFQGYLEGPEKKEISSGQPSSVWKSGATNLRLQSSESCRRGYKCTFYDFFFDFCCCTPW